MASHETFDIPIGKVVGPKGDTGTGIKSIKLLSTSGLVKTYRITMTDDTTFDFVVTDGNGITGASFDAQTNALTLTFDDGTSFTTPSLKGTKGDTGNGISKIEKTGTDGLVDTYTVTYTDGQTFTYTVTNGADGVSPEVTVTQISGGHTVEIEDAGGVKTFDVLDGEVTEARMAEALATKAPVILETVSGAIASFDDGADSMPVKKLVAQIEPVQDLHGYDSPWPAGGGANLVPNVYAFNSGYSRGGVTFTYGDDGIIYMNGTATAGYEERIVAIENLPVGTYTAKGNINHTDAAIYVRKNGTFVGSVKSDPVTFSVEDGDLVSLTIIITNGATYSNVSLKLILSAGSSVGEWTPYSNICPISGWTGADINGTGKNLINIPNFENTSATTIDESTKSIFRAFPYEANTQYTFQCDCVVGPSRAFGMYIGYVDGTWEYKWFSRFGVVNKSVTTKANATVSSAQFVYDFVQTVSLSNFMMEEGSTATAYEPYTGNQISVTFPDEAGDSGTVYGGTLTVNPDRTGTLVVTDRKDVFDDVNNISLYWSQAGTYGTRFNIGLRTTNKIGSVDFVSNVLVPTNDVYSYSNWKPYQGYPWRDNTNDFFLILPLEYTIDRIADAKTLIASWGLEICYKLLTPVEIPLTASEVSSILTTLYGQNNIWADTGNVEVTYPADTKLYIDNKITQAIANALNS